MKVNVTSEKYFKKTLEIEVSQEEVDSRFEATVSKYRTKAKIPGFRAGKVPLELIKSTFEQAIQEDVLNQLVPEAYEKALQETKLSPIGYPILKEINLKPGQPLTFKAEIELKPEIEVADYLNIEIEAEEIKFKPENIQEVLNNLRENQAEFVVVDKPASEGDYLIVDLVEKIELNKSKEKKFPNQTVELNSKVLLKEFYDNLVGLKSGQEKDFQVNYPADYVAKSLASKKVNYKVKIREVKEKVLPEVNDEFAKRVGNYQNLAELKAKISENLEKNVEQQNRNNRKTLLISKIVEKNAFEVPEAYINSYLAVLIRDFKRKYKNVDEEKIREEYRPVGINQIRWEFIYHKIAEKEHITVKEEEIGDRIEKFAEAQKIELKQAQQFLEKTNQVKQIYDSILEEKVLDLLLSRAKINKKK